MRNEMKKITDSMRFVMGKLTKIRHKIKGKFSKRGMKKDEQYPKKFPPKKK